MRKIQSDQAAREIRQACVRAGERNEHSPFFFIVGAGISHPPVPLASDITQQCRAEAERWGAPADARVSTAEEDYSRWFSEAYPQPTDRQLYLRSLMEKAFISRANLRLAHLLLDNTIGHIVVTPNFDDLLSRALNLFGRRHIVCDHPGTVERVNVETRDVQIVHVHGTYWFYDCLNLRHEIGSASRVSATEAFTTSSLLDDIFRNRVPIVVGYSGWEGDVIMNALKRRLAKPVPRNIYWCCYREAEADSTPEWLHEHPNFVAVVPRPAAAHRSTGESGEASGATVKESVLSAVGVFDALIREFKLEPPSLTRDPLRFLAQQLRESLWTDDDDAEDVYAIRALIRRVERIRDGETQLRLRSNASLDAVREALRRSEHRQAIKSAEQLDFELLDDDELRELAFSIGTAAGSLLDDSPDESSGYSLTVKAVDALMARGRGEAPLNERSARALLNSAITFLNRKETDLSIDTFDELLRRFADAPEPVLRAQVARALRGKGFALGTLNRSADAITVYDELLRRFADAPETALREPVAGALRNKGVMLGTLGRHNDAIAVYDELFRRFADAPEPALREQVAKALTNKGFSLETLNRDVDAVAVYDEALRRFADAPEPALREQVARALVNKGATLGDLNRSEEEMAVYDEVLRRFADAPESALRELVALALLNKGATLGDLNRSDDAIAAYDEVLRRFADAPEPAVREQVATAMKNRAGLLPLGAA